jgi:alkyl hydroperoxide reductase subunit AhpC
MVLKFGFSEVEDSTKVFSETSVYLHDMVIIEHKGNFTFNCTTGLKYTIHYRNLTSGKD